MENFNIEDNTILYIFAKQKNVNYWSYMINDNTESHMASFDQLYYFIASKIKPPITVQVLEWMRNGKSFLVNIKDNTIHEFMLDNKEELEKYRSTMFNTNLRKINQEQEEIDEHWIEDVKKTV